MQGRHCLTKRGSQHGPAIMALHTVRLSVARRQEFTLVDFLSRGSTVLAFLMTGRGSKPPAASKAFFKAGRFTHKLLVLKNLYLRTFWNSSSSSSGHCAASRSKRPPDVLERARWPPFLSASVRDATYGKEIEEYGKNSMRRGAQPPVSREVLMVPCNYFADGWPVQYLHGERRLRVRKPCEEFQVHRGAKIIRIRDEHVLISARHEHQRDA